MNIYDSLQRTCPVLQNAKSRRKYLLISVVLTMISCSSNHPESESGDDVATSCTDSIPAEEEAYIAENDIAMTVRSIADAINVGEELDTTEYNFEGVLTDGQGTPLYTDVQGAPGQWMVDVIGPNAVRIRNMYLGDLLPDNLTGYIAESLELSEKDEIIEENIPEEDETFSVYDFGKGSIRIESKPAITPTGEIGPMVSITLIGDSIPKIKTELLPEHKPASGFEPRESH